MCKIVLKRGRGIRPQVWHLVVVVVVDPKIVSTGVGLNVGRREGRVAGGVFEESSLLNCSRMNLERK
jgi:hypothetical protein